MDYHCMTTCSELLLDMMLSCQELPCRKCLLRASKRLWWRILAFSLPSKMQFLVSLSIFKSSYKAVACTKFSQIYLLWSSQSSTALEAASHVYLRHSAVYLLVFMFCVLRSDMLFFWQGADSTSSSKLTSKSTEQYKTKGQCSHHFSSSPAISFKYMACHTKFKCCKCKVR